MASINLFMDFDEFLERSEELVTRVTKRRKEAVEAVANELLRLSQLEVPHDVGTLQNSGHTEPERDDMLVGYNTPYAARLHENPQFRFQKGRKGKYLEDPMKKNLRLFRDVLDNEMGEVLK